MMKQVKGRKNMYRDPETNAIIYKHDDEYQEYVKRRNSRLYKEELIEKTAEELEQVKSEISEIKELLLKLASSINT
jgi:K+/H+ antiporter YhaU regulatory subunit KhtT